MIRITADLDTKNKFKIGYYVMKAIIIIKSIKSLELKQSNSKGYHLIIWSSYPYTLKKHFNIRASIGDDKRRIKIDKTRKVGRNTLFDFKINLKSQKNKTLKSDIGKI